VILLNEDKGRSFERKALLNDKKVKKNINKTNSSKDTPNISELLESKRIVFVLFTVNDIK